MAQINSVSTGHLNFTSFKSWLHYLHYSSWLQYLSWCCSNVSFKFKHWRPFLASPSFAPIRLNKEWSLFTFEPRSTNMICVWGEYIIHFSLWYQHMALSFCVADKRWSSRGWSHHNAHTSQKYCQNVLWGSRLSCKETQISKLVRGFEYLQWAHWQRRRNVGIRTEPSFVTWQTTYIR